MANTSRARAYAVEQRNISVAPRRDTRHAVVTPMPRVERNEVRRVHKRSPLKAASIMLVASMFLIALWSVLYMDAKITETDAKISSIDSKISKLTSENTELELKIEGMMSMKNVEDYAITKLGMQKVSRNQITYIKLNESDKIEIDKSEKNLFKKISDFLV